MVNCTMCPIQEECKDIKERITDRYVAGTLPYISGALDFCPLVKMINDKFEAASEELFDL